MTSINAHLRTILWSSTMWEASIGLFETEGVLHIEVQRLHLVFSRLACVDLVSSCLRASGEAEISGSPGVTYARSTSRV